MHLAKIKKVYEFTNPRQTNKFLHENENSVLLAVGHCSRINGFVYIVGEASDNDYNNKPR